MRVFATIKRVSSGGFGVSAFFLVLMLPLGRTQNEILGRILQIGFFMPALSLLLLFWRDRCASITTRRFIDLAIFLSAGTNPLVFALLAAYFVYIIVMNNLNLVATCKNNALLIALLTPLAIAILYRLHGHGSINADFAAFNLIETVTARSILFPLIFRYYKQLSNPLSLSILAVYGLLLVIAIRVSDNIEAKRLSYALVIAIIISIFFTMLMRPGLTGILNNYHTTFPDRYFMGINVLSSILMVLVVMQLVNSSKTKSLGLLIGGVIALTYLCGQHRILEFKKSKLPIRTNLSFKEQICASKQVSPGLYKITIYPDYPVFNMTIPAQYINKLDCSLPLEHCTTPSCSNG